MGVTSVLFPALSLNAALIKVTFFTLNLGVVIGSTAKILTKGKYLLNILIDVPSFEPTSKIQKSELNGRIFFEKLKPSSRSMNLQINGANLLKKI